MCGIAGFQGRFEPHLLPVMGERIVHRGPDDYGECFVHDHSVGLVHRRLAIIDLSATGHQPMASADGQTILIFNGEIYNFQALRSELLNKGYAFRGSSDTEVLLNLYQAEGEGMLSRLNGIFAFAIWDGRKRSLFIARDALGVKPLYYVTTPIGIGFSSEIKALLCLLSGRRELDYASLNRYMTFLWCPGEGTPLKAIRKLPPGEAMIIQDSRIKRRWAWYRLPACRGVDEMLTSSAAIAQTASKVRTAVERQMVADVPVGAFLSGGLDSSAVVAFAKDIDSRIACFTIDSAGDQDPGFVDDLPYARQVADHLGVQLHIVRVEAAQMASDLETMVAQLDEPLADPAALNVLYISRLARLKGIKVLLSGAGGDDIFSGYRRHLALRYELAWSWLPLRARKALTKVASRLDKRRPLGRRLHRLLSHADKVGDNRLAGYFAWIPENELRSLYSPEFQAALTESASEPLVDFLQTVPKSVPNLERMLAVEQRFFLADHNLIYTDKMSMAAGVEVRVPFLDLDLVEFAARIPDQYKQRRTVGKWVLKKAMEPYLPHEIIYRNKSGFGAPLRRWMRNDLRELVGDLLSPESVRRRGLFNAGAVQSMITLNDTGAVDSSYTLLSLLTIEIWCRHFVDNPRS